MIHEEPGYAHLAALTDRFGTYEHAEGTVPRRDHGYCVDDAARVLVVTARDPHPTTVSRRLLHGALRFVIEAQDATGASRNRRDVTGRWHGPHGTDDCWGRSLWGFGVASAVPALQGSMAVAAFERGARRRSRSPRAMAFAGLGAAAVLATDPRNRAASALLDDVGEVLGSLAAAAASDATASAWPWLESRLTYANAVLPEAMVAAGTALDRPRLVADGLELLGWLLDRETTDGHLSVTPASGAGPADPHHGFDQQPIEVAAMADACARAALVDGAPRWFEGLRAAAAWFDGANDCELPMWDRTSSGGYDGLMDGSVNLNQGAESTLALVSTHHLARSVTAVVR